VDVEFEEVEERVRDKVDCAVDILFHTILVRRTEEGRGNGGYLFRRQRRVREAAPSHYRSGKVCIVTGLLHPQSTSSVNNPL